MSPPVPEPPPDAGRCRPCRGTGQVISNLGGSPSTIVCPWCGGTGRLPAAEDAPAEAS